MENLKTFVHLKDDIVFAYHQSATEVDIPGDNIIQVDVEGDSLLNKKYSNGNFIDAPVIKYAILDEDNDNTVISIQKTVYSSEVTGPIIDSNDVKVLWKWNGSEFIEPAKPETYSTIVVGSQRVTTSLEVPAITESQLLEIENKKEAQQPIVIISEPSPGLDD
jgi:hypothetical protein